MSSDRHDRDTINILYNMHTKLTDTGIFKIYIVILYLNNRHLTCHLVRGVVDFLTSKIPQCQGYLS